MRFEAPGPSPGPVPDPLGPIARHLATSPPDDRTFRRRRLASLAGVLTLVLAVGAVAGQDRDDTVQVTTDVAAGAETVRTASLGTPTGVRELLSETTTTLVEATGATTSTTGAPTTTTEAPATSTTTPATGGEDADPTDDAGEASTTTEAAAPRALTTEAPTTTAAPTTTQAPRREAIRRAAPPTTAAPSTTAAPPTTAAPTTTAPPSPAPSAGYADDDPRGTQVWHDLARCESGGNWSIDTGNGYYGGLQFSLATWESVGGTGYPHEHSVATQIEHGRRLQARQGWGAWPHCSQELGLR